MNRFEFVREQRHGMHGDINIARCAAGSRKLIGEIQEGNDDIFTLGDIGAKRDLCKTIGFVNGR